MDAALPAAPPPRSRFAWVRRWWGKVILAWVFLVLVGLLSFAFLVADQTRDIRLESGRFRGDFSAFAGDRPSVSDESGSLFRTDDPQMGNPDAQLTIVAFEDFECPYSGRAFPTIREVLAAYGDRIHFVYRDFPLDELHPHARRAAEAAQCAHDQGKFWAYHDRLYQHQSALADADLTQYAQSVGLDVPAFTQCLENGTTRDRVAQDLLDGVSRGVEGTPTFFFNGQRVTGAIPREAFDEIIDLFLE